MTTQSMLQNFEYQVLRALEYSSGSFSTHELREFLADEFGYHTSNNLAINKLLKMKGYKSDLKLHPHIVWNKNEYVKIEKLTLNLNWKIN